MITDKVHQLTIDRKPESEQLNYIDKPQRSHSPKPNVQAGPIDSQRGRYDDPVRKVRFSQRLHSNNPVRTGNGFQQGRNSPSPATSRHQIGGSRYFSNNRSQPRGFEQRGSVNRDGKQNLKTSKERLCFRCGSQFHFIAKCPLTENQPNRFQSREWTPRRIEGGNK